MSGNLSYAFTYKSNNHAAKVIDLPNGNYTYSVYYCYMYNNVVDNIYLC